MSQPTLFKYRHYPVEIIMLCLRWYLRYSLSYRDLEEMMLERGLSVVVSDLGAANRLGDTQYGELSCGYCCFPFLHS